MASPEKYLPVDKSPVFDRHDDPNNEDFVNANDPERKFVPINEVADKNADFTDSLDAKEEEIEINEPVDEQKELEEVRKDIGHYTYTGPDNVALASFHVDHDKEEMIGVTEEGLASFRPTDPETIEDAPLEEEFAETNITRDKKVSAMSVPENDRRYKDNRSDKENLKTMPENKVERGNRGLIRKFLHDVWNKN